MGRRAKLKSKIRTEEEEEEEEEEKYNNNSFSFIVDNSGDEEEGNEDLSLKIKEKARLQALSKEAENDIILNTNESGVVSNNISSSSSQEGVVVVDPTGSSVGPKSKRKTRKKKKKSSKENSLEANIFNNVTKEEENVGVNEAIENVVTPKTLQNVSAVEPSPVEQSDNLVLRKLLRGPRYFDPPDTSWGTCYNCGEEGHKTANCTATKRRRPCFVCGSLEHNVKQCTKGQDCFICKKGGHRAKDCPEKHKSGSHLSKICLRCGDSGHDMLTCRNDYLKEDLKEIQCYVCKKFGHLCCVNSTDTCPSEVSCYRCGQLGHIGLACARLCEESIGAGSPSSCYKCGEEGHFARECTGSAKAYTRLHADTFDPGSSSSCYKCGREGHYARECTRSTKRSRGLSTKRFVGDENYLRSMSEPHEVVKHGKKKKIQHEENSFTTPHKLKRRGGWITEDPEESPFPRRKAKVDSWRSPSTPTDKRHKIHTYNNGSQVRSYRKTPMLYSETSSPMLYPGTLTSQGSAKGFYNRFSASRYDNSSSDGRSRNYDWW